MNGDLQPEAVTALTAILHHLDLPIYNSGDKAGRKLWQGQLESRVADVVAMLHGLLSIPAEEAVDVARELRALAAQSLPLYETTGERGVW